MPEGEPPIVPEEVSEVDSSSLDWQESANCINKDPDIFFPERGASTKEAKAICKECDVREECLEYAFKNGERRGIWGGTSERERRQIRKQRAILRTAARRAIRESELSPLES